jgi:hypothetical protein
MEDLYLQFTSPCTYPYVTRDIFCNVCSIVGHRHRRESDENVKNGQLRAENGRGYLERSSEMAGYELRMAGWTGKELDTR